MEIHSIITQFGFEFGAAEVTRTSIDEKRGSVNIRVKTKKEILQIYVTKTGKIRVYKQDKLLKSFHENAWKELK